MPSQTIPTDQTGAHLSVSISLADAEVWARVQVMSSGHRCLILTLGGDFTLCVSAEQWRTIKAVGDAALVEQAEAGAA